MQLRQLEYFVSLCETLNFTRTAGEFFVSQTAVTQQIKALEEELNATLFERSHRHVAVTPVGKQFYDDAKLILRQLRDAELRVRSYTDNIIGSLKIGFLTCYEREGITALMHTFHRLYPNVTLSLLCLQSADLNRELGLGNVDLIIAHRYWEEGDDLDSLQLRCYPLMCIMAHDHPLAALSAIRPEDLQNHRVVTVQRSNEGAGEVTVVNRFFLKAGILPDIAFRSPNIEADLVAVGAGLGYMLVPSYLCALFDPAAGIEARPILGHEKETTVAAIWRKDNTNPLIPKVLDLCSTMFRQTELK